MLRGDNASLGATVRAWVSFLLELAVAFYYLVFGLGAGMTKIMSIKRTKACLAIIGGFVAHTIVIRAFLGPLYWRIIEIALENGK